MLSLFLIITILISFSSQAPHEKRSSLSFALDGNFPDPAFVQVDGRFYAFATTNGRQNVPIAVSDDFSKWTIAGEDALRTVPSWSKGGIWAPDVVQLADGSFVMYMSATSLEDTSKHCVGMAKSASVTGPYEPVENQICPLKQGGAIDPAGFHDVDGTQWLVYKIDGNSLGGGGQCGNGDFSHSTPIMLQQVSADDGITLIGSPRQILDRGKYDGPLIEAPSLLRTSEGVYIIFFSSNCYNGHLYDTSYATSTNGIFGPYEKATKPLLVTGDSGGRLQSPGGLDVGPLGINVMFHSDKEPGDPAVRQMWTGQLSIHGRSVQIVA